MAALRVLLCAAAVARPCRGIDVGSLRIGTHLSSGAFGHVHCAQLGSTPVVVKRAAAGVTHAARYLEVEAEMNSRLQVAAPGSRHIAPYLGSCTVNGTRALLWRRVGGSFVEEDLDCSADCSLESCLLRSDAPQLLSSALGLPPNEDALLMRRLLEEILSSLALVHSQRIVHRDVKPANLLLDRHSQTLRLIDFGSGCEPGMSGGGPSTSTRGLSRFVGASAARFFNLPAASPPARDPAPASTLYMAPEQLVSAEAPFGFDVYSAAICWLRAIVPAFRTSEEELYRFRIAVRDNGHQVHEPPPHLYNSHPTSSTNGLMRRSTRKAASSAR